MYHTIEDAAKIMKCSPQQVRRHIKNGLQASNVGLGSKRKDWRISEDAIREYMEGRLIKTKAVVRKVTQYYDAMQPVFDCECYSLKSLVPHCTTIYSSHRWIGMTHRVIDSHLIKT